jgi:hypothetical protein
LRTLQIDLCAQQIRITILESLYFITNYETNDCAT